MASSKNNMSYHTLISLRNKLTCLNGMITLEAVNRLKDELGRIFTVAKTHHYEQGQKYGHLASAIPKPAMCTHTVPADPGAYSLQALAIIKAATL
jgi:hypothetical protein